MWQKFGMAYAYGFKGIGEQANNPFFELSSSYPELVSDFQYLSGLAVLAPSVLLGLFIGKLSDSVNRVQLLGIACLAWSGSTYLAGVEDNFAVFTAARIALGIFSVAAVTPAVGLIRDLFPARLQSRAIAIYLASDQIGCSISALSLILIQTYGWRLDYEVTGLFGIIAGLSMLIFIQEPERGRFDVQPTAIEADADMDVGPITSEDDDRPIFAQIVEAGQELGNNPTGKLVLAASSIRAIGTNCLGFYKPLYFQIVYQDNVE